MDSLLQQQVTANIAMFGIATSIAVAAVSPPARSHVETIPVALAAQSEPLSPAPALATLSPPGLIGQQIQFHVAFATDFLSTGAQLFARELPIPLTLAADIGNGTPVPTAVSRALNDFAAVELDAGNALLTFGAEYVGFQAQFAAGLIPHRSAGATNTTLVARPVVGSAPDVPAIRGVVRRLLTTASANPLADAGGQTSVSRGDSFRPLRLQTNRQSDQGASSTTGSSGAQHRVLAGLHKLRNRGHSD
jgi:hypothetical protein